MDESLKSKTVLVYDYKNYVETAIRLKREFGRVLYYKPWKDTTPQTTSLIIGDGYTEIERVKNFYDVIHEVDLFVFPDVYDADLQLDLERRGKRVWGARKAEEFEYKRGLFAKTLDEVGLPVAPFKKVVGFTALKKYLFDHDNQWVKIEMRGDRETWHHQDMVTSQPTLDAIGYYYGPVKEQVSFYVFDSIDSVIEAAYDGYMVTSPDGRPQFPSDAFLGYEVKNKGHILAVVDYSSLHESVLEVNEAFAPKLAERYFRSQWGTEIKIGEDGTNYFLDATCRQPSPPGEIVLELVKNLGEIMYHGSEGRLIEMEVEKPFAVQVALNSAWAGQNYLGVPIPEEIRQWVKLSECCRVDGIDWIVPPEPNDTLGGWTKHFGDVVAVGDSIQEAIDLVKERCELLTGFDCEMQLSALSECLSRIHKGEDEGIAFADKVPKPASVIEE